MGWLAVTLVTPPTDEATLLHFYRFIRPAGPGWNAVIELSIEILCMVTASFTVHFALFATGYWIHGRTVTALILTVLAIVGTVVLLRLWGQLKTEVADEAHEVLPSEIPAK